MKAWFNKFLEQRHYAQDQLNDDFSFKRRSFKQWLANSVYIIIKRLPTLSFTNLAFVSIIFFVLLVVLVLLVPDLIKFKTDYFKENVVPTFFGLFLDSFLILGLFGLLQNRSEKKRKEQIRLTIRSLYVPYLKILNTYLSTASVKQRSDYDNPELLYSLLSGFSILYLGTEKSKRQEFIAEIIAFAKNYLEKYNTVIAILAQLDPEFLRIGIQIDRRIRQLIETSTDERMFTHTNIDLIGALLELDELNYAGWKTKKNIQQLMNLDRI